MDKFTLFWIALALAWLSGALFGMGFERRLLERKNRNIQTKNSNDCAPH